MRSRTMMLAIGLILLGSASPLYAQVQPANGPAAPGVTLGTPQPLAVDPTPAFRPLGAIAPSVVRGQAPPPPPAFPGGGPPPLTPPPAGMYNQGVVNSDADLGSFWSRVGDKFKHCWDDISGNAAGAFQSSPKRQMFQSDHEFDVFSSPVTNPFYFMDPRALTEVRPVFIWQRTSGHNNVWNGGDNFDYTLVGSVAVTENISLVINRIGFTTIAPHGGAPGISSNTGFSELMLGPKLTFLRNESSGTVAAVGLTFDIPDGSSAVLQDTGRLAVTPYFSIAQNFGRSDYGSFNFMNTTGYNFRTDNVRSESFFSSFHLDYEIAKRVWPFVEINWLNYTRNGNARGLRFEDGDLGNFGSQGVAGQNELTLAVGTRVKLNSFIFWGVAAEFNVLNNNTGQHLDAFRLTTDLIFRY